MRLNGWLSQRTLDRQYLLSARCVVICDSIRAKAEHRPKKQQALRKFLNTLIRHWHLAVKGRTEETIISDKPTTEDPQLYLGALICAPTDSVEDAGGMPKCCPLLLLWLRFMIIVHRSVALLSEWRRQGKQNEEPHTIYYKSSYKVSSSLWSEHHRLNSTSSTLQLVRSRSFQAKHQQLRGGGCELLGQGTSGWINRNCQSIRLFYKNITYLPNYLPTYLCIQAGRQAASHLTWDPPSRFTFFICRRVREWMACGWCATHCSIGTGTHRLCW